ncbi:hypothetical protein [Primorskyibacter flagellatus]|uniref:Uncharacterized protein n=1 Tax=Primorskyibacter flagellatus TaxID=1387277 RepID=A0A1W2DVU8_9RHOB|nr:hypothetical protein [Primorskyibacter flagellatus]SMD01128.1 hypothetical protein SAMN06295998_11823 [Primorskyibacter flagellatus]
MPKHHHHPPRHHGQYPPDHFPRHNRAGSSRVDERWSDTHGHNAERLAVDAMSSGAQVTLAKLLPNDFVTWLTRAMAMSPPEMLAIFRMHVATIEHQLVTLTQIGVSTPQFDPYDLATGQASIEAIGSALSGTHQRHVLDDAMLGPIEVQAVAFVSLISLRLADLSSTTPMIDKVDDDV